MTKRDTRTANAAEQEMTPTKWEALLLIAHNAFCSGHVVLAADACRKMLLALPPAEGKGKFGFRERLGFTYGVLRAYGAAIDELSGTASHSVLRQDMRCLEGVALDNSETVLIRCNALESLARLLYFSGYRQSSADCCRIAISWVDAAPKWEKKMKLIIRIPGVEDRQKLKIGTDLLALRERFTRFLAVLEKPCTLDIQLPPQKGSQRFLTLQAIGGNKCDYCGVTRQELGVAVLETCAKCHLMFYCSVECHEADWKKGHKHVCGHRKSVRAGDTMQVMGQRNIVLVQILEADPSQEGNWMAQLLSEEDGNGFTTEIKSYPSSRLRHIRLAAACIEKVD